jgi:hypothetical protein
VASTTENGAAAGGGVVVQAARAAARIEMQGRVTFMPGIIPAIV